MDREEFLDKLKVNGRYSRLRATKEWLIDNNLYDIFLELTKDITHGDHYYKMLCLRCDVTGKCACGCGAEMPITKGKVYPYKVGHSHFGKPAHNRAKIDEAKIIDAYNSGMSALHISQQEWCTVSNVTVKSILERNGIDVRGISEAIKSSYPIKKWVVAQPRKVEWKSDLGDRYKNGESLEVIARDYNCHSWTVFCELRRQGYIKENDKTTTIEKILINILKKNDIEYKLHDRVTLGDKKEIDLYLPKYRVGIEANGLYWHSTTDAITDYSHINKFQLAVKNDIKLLQFWEHDIHNRTSLIESMILAKCGLLSNRVYARKCSIIDMSITMANNIFNEWHIQGATAKSAKAKALTYNDEIVAVIAYTVTNDFTRIERYCCKPFTNVVGGYTRLERQLQGSVLVTYSLGLISDGSVYRANGYTSNGYSTRPEFYVTDTDNLFNRQKFMKHKMRDLFGENFNPELTEWENIINNGLRLVFGAGITKWVKIR